LKIQYHVENIRLHLDRKEESEVAAFVVANQKEAFGVHRPLLEMFLADLGIGMIVALVQKHIGIDEGVYPFCVTQGIDFEIIDTDRIGGKVKDIFFTFSQKIVYAGFADHLFSIFQTIILPAGKCQSGPALEIVDDDGLLGCTGLREPSLPLTYCTFTESLEGIGIEEIEGLDELLLGEIVLCYAGFEVVAELHLGVPSSLIVTV